MEPNVCFPESKRVNGAGADSVQAFLCLTLAAGLSHVLMIFFKGLEEEVQLSRDHIAPLVICHHLHIRRNLFQKSKTGTLSHAGSATKGPFSGSSTNKPGLFITILPLNSLHYRSAAGLPPGEASRQKHVRRSWVGYAPSPPPERVGTFAPFLPWLELTPDFSRHQTVSNR